MEERIDLLARRARRLRAHGEYRKAANTFGELTSVDPDHAPWWVLLGATLTAAHRSDEAVKAFRQAMYLLRRAGESGRANAVRGLVARTSGLTAAA